MQSSVATKLMASKTLVRPILGYSAVVWDSYLQTDIYRFDSVQNKAVRFIFNKYGWDFSLSSAASVLELKPPDKKAETGKIAIVSQDHQF